MSKRVQTAGEHNSADYCDTSAHDETLADRLGAGPLPLSLALAYASHVATTLRKSHYEGYAHGWVNAAAVVMENGRAVLKGGNASRQATLNSDVVAFGALLYELVNGRKTGPDVPLPVVPRTVARNGAEGIKMAANRLASRCLAGDSLNMQKVATEVRLLKVLAAQLPVVKAPLAGSAAETLVVSPDQVRDEGAAGLAHETDDHSEMAEDSLANESSFAKTHCPRCGSAHVFTSKSRTRLERLLQKVGSPVQRCHRCYHRYFTVVGIHFPKAAPAG